MINHRSQILGKFYEDLFFFTDNNLSGPRSADGRMPVSEEDLTLYNTYYGVQLGFLKERLGVDKETLIELMREYEDRELPSDRARYTTSRILMCEQKVNNAISVRNNERLQKDYMRMAHSLAISSTADNRRVGAILVDEYGIVAEGRNGTVPGSPNLCENPHTGRSYEWVLHAERNAINKVLARGYLSLPLNLLLFVTTMPCPTCAEYIVKAGISTVYFSDFHRRTSDSLKILTNASIPVIRIVSEDI
jgi:dCMP deaminase